MATLWIESESGPYTQLGFSTGYSFGFYGFHSADYVRIIGGGRLDEDSEYLIKKVKISNKSGTGFWWLGEPRSSYFDSFRELMDEIAPGCLTKRCVVLQLVVERI